MQIISKASVLFIFAMALATFQLWGTQAQAQSSYFTNRGCVNCHAAPAVATCAGCHQHSGTLAAATNKTSYSPGETVTVTLTSSGARTGWIGVRLYDQSGAEIARATGNQSGMGGSATYPAALSAPAPATAGTYTWKIAYFGNNNGTGTGDVHSEKSVNVSFTVASAADTTAPVVSAFTLPATVTNLTVPVTTFTAADNVAVTGYRVTTSATAPLASASGWTTVAPASVAAASAGNNTFYAWAKDAAGNVSLARSASVTVTLPDTTAPVVGSFTLPATATSLTVPVSTFTASDNVAVTGYLITTSASAPAASASGWSASVPASVTAVPGSNTFYAWARDAAGNVSAAKSASVTLSSANTLPSLTVSSLADGSYTNTATLNVSGSASDSDGIQSVTVNGQDVTVNPDGSFSTALLLQAGANTVTVIASDRLGGQNSVTRTVTYDPNAPVLAISSPADNSSTVQSLVAVSGTVNETSTVSVKVNNGSPQSAAISGNGYSATVNLAAGVNTIDVTATDLAGNVSNAKRTVNYDNSSSTFTLAVTNPSQDITTSSSSLTLRGTIADALSRVTVRIKVDGKSYSPRVVNGAFQQRLTFTRAKRYAIAVTARDEAGNSSTVYRNVIYRPAGDDDDDNRTDSGSTTSHPFGWTSPRSSHPGYVEKNGVSSCVSCHSTDQASKGQAMSCYNCHGKEW